MASLLDLFVRLGMDNSDFKKGKQEASGLIDDLGAKAEGLGINFAAMAEGFTVAGIVAGLLKIGTTMEEASFTIQRATGASGEALDSLNQDFQNVYQTSARSAEEVAGALAMMAQRTDLTGGALEGATEDALAFAKVTGQDVRTAVESTQKVFALWEVSIAEQPGALDLMYRATQLTGIGMQQLQGSMLSAAPALQSLGYNFTDALAIIGNFYKKGLDLESVLPVLSKGLITLAKSTDDPKAALQDLFDRMQNASSSAEAATIAAETLGGKKGGGLLTLAIAVRNGALDFDALKGKIEQARGAVQDISDKTTGWGAAFTKLRHAVNDSFSFLGVPLTELLKNATDKLAEFFDKNKSKMAEFQTSLLFYAALAAGKVLGVPSGPAQPGGSAPPPDRGNVPNPGVNPPAPTAEPWGPGNPEYDKAAAAEDAEFFKEQERRYTEYNLQLTALLGQLTGAQHKLAEEWAKEYLVAQQQDAIYQQTGVSVVELAESDLPKLTTSTKDISKAIKDASAEGSAMSIMWAAEKEQMDAQLKPMRDLQQAFRDFHLKDDDADLEKFTKDLAILSKGVQDGTVSVTDYQKAWIKTADTMVAAGQDMSAKMQLQYAAIKFSIDSAKQSATLFYNLETTAANDMASGLADIVMHVKTVGQVFAKLGQDILRILLDVVIKQGITQLLTALGLIPVANSTVAFSEVMADAAVAAAAAFASTAAIPIVGPFEAPAAAAEAYAAVSSFAPLTAFAQGGIVDHEMLAHLHENEAVLPADIAGPLRESLKGGRGGIGTVIFNVAGHPRDTVREIAKLLKVSSPVFNY